MDIFVDVVAAVTKKTVNKRNKMLHVNAEKKYIMAQLSRQKFDVFIMN